MTIDDALLLVLRHPQPLPKPSRVALIYAHLTVQCHNGNISAAARALNMDRRSLQRMLRKKVTPHVVR